ncbi:hypothetical protein [Amycolatopsis sulphurea]|nr:hypothetical protein [Amycolatopsis sulphurea]
MPDEVPMSHEELRRKYETNLDDLSPEDRAMVLRQRESLREAFRRGDERRAREGGEPPRQRPGDNFAIGLSDDFTPYPTKRPSE